MALLYYHLRLVQTMFPGREQGLFFFPLSAEHSFVQLSFVFFLLPSCICDFSSLLLVGCAVPAAVQDCQDRGAPTTARAGAGPLSSLVPSCPLGLCVAMAKDMRDVTHQISIEK